MKKVYVNTKVRFLNRLVINVILYDDGEQVDKDNQIVLVADDSERYLDPNQNNVILCKTPYTKFTRAYEENFRISDDNDNYLEYQIDPTILDILIKDIRCLPLVTDSVDK